jgi:hemerythrin-like domain-containing protein
VSALKVLLEEHVIIMNVIGVLNRAKENLETGKEVPQDFFGKTVDIIRNFADKCHHGKEETVLFPTIKKRDTNQTGLISLLLEEHEKGREFIRNLGKAINENNNNEIIKNIDGYVALLPQHIRRENAVFPKWINALSEKEKEEIYEKFEEVEERAIGLGKHQEYAHNVEILKKSLL